MTIHKAMAIARPCVVIVADAGGDLTNALIGEMMLARMVGSGLAGIFINGAVRDAGFSGGRKFRVFAASVTHRGRYKNEPGEINVRIALDGMVIEPGDLVVGDDDVLFCTPERSAEGSDREVRG